MQLPFFKSQIPFSFFLPLVLSPVFLIYVFKFDTEFIIVILYWVNSVKTTLSLPEPELFLKYLNIFRQLKGLNKLFSRHGEEEKIKCFDGNCKKNNNAIFISFKIFLSLFYLLNQLHMESYLKNININIFSRKERMINSHFSY